MTAHEGARPAHAEWQGKVYSRSGKSKKYPSLVDKTGYGTGPGLGGWNCRHSMFPYYDGTGRVYTDEELEELKNDKKDDTIVPYIRKNVINNYNTKNEENNIKKAISIIANEKQSFAKILEDNLEFEIINKESTDKNYSRYDKKLKKVYIYQNSDEYEVIHEVGHLIEDTFLKNNKAYLRLKQQIADESKLTIISRGNGKYYALKNDNFVEEYQGYLHIQDKTQIFKNGKVDVERATEIFSESFREYFENRDNLKRKLPKIYDLIKEMLK